MPRNVPLAPDEEKELTEEIRAAMTAMLDASPGRTAATGLAARVNALLHAARPVLINFDARARVDIAPWTDRVDAIDARCEESWTLPAIGPVTKPDAVLVRPDGYVAWVGRVDEPGVADALARWFGPPTAC